MFAQVKEDFEERVLEVDHYFNLLAAIDNEELTVCCGTGAQVVPEGSPPSEWGRMLKGAAYLVLYNVVEAFVRRGFEAVYEAIKHDRLCGIHLTQHLRTQWVLQKNRKVKPFNGSPEVYMKITHEIVQEIEDNTIAQLSRHHLPISGNLDADAIREVCMAHGIDARTPPEAKGGEGLMMVKNKRNALSHGDESFEECGRDLTATELIQSKDQIVLFLEKYH